MKKANLYKRLAAVLLTISLIGTALSGCSGKTAETADGTSSSADVSGAAADTADKGQDSSVTGTGKSGDSKKNKETVSTETDYESRLFDASYVHTIEITISEEDWSDLKTNPTDKTKYKTTVTVDGESFTEVSFATKGNTSLSSVASNPDSDRYSFKLNFGKYNKGQTYYGLKKLNLNNLYSDATYMKDYLSYEISRETGVEAPLTSYVWLTVNGEDHGLYLAIEDISESYLNRVADGEGELYKPETEMLGNMDKVGGKDGDQPGGEFPGGEFPGGNFPGGEMPSLPQGNGQSAFPQGGGFSDTPQGGDFSGTFPGGNFPGGEMPSMPQGGDFSGNFPGGDFPGNMPGGFGTGSNGADLVYKDDEISSYSDIFDNAETDAEEEDEQRVIAALKALSEGDVSGIDTDEVIRYFAAHNFVLNYDSYTGSLLHNYYLYENDGKLSMLPWDYNLAFGGFSGGDDATSLVNTGIDTPLSGSQESARPMWSWIVSDESYLEQYHQVYDELISGYFESGRFAEEIDALYEMLLPYVEKDPSSFYTAEEFTKAYETLKEFCLLRAESIRRQISGTLSAKTNEQDASARVDASGLSVRDMGTQGGGGNQPGGNQPGGFGGGGFNFNEGSFPGGQSGSRPGRDGSGSEDGKPRPGGQSGNRPDGSFPGGSKGN